MIFSSCDVNTMKYHDGRTEVMQAKRKIRLKDWQKKSFSLSSLIFSKKLGKDLKPNQ